MSSRIRLLPISFLLALLAAGPALAGTEDVPKGGIVLDVGTGASALQLDLRNQTGDGATGVLLTLFRDDLQPAAGILLLDVLSRGDDRVDDDNDGQLGGGAEGDTLDSTPAPTCRSILTGNPLAPGASIILDVGIANGAPLLPGTNLHVLFCADFQGIQFDLCQQGGLDLQGPLSLDVPMGTHLAHFEIVNQMPQPLDVLHLMAPPDLPFLWMLPEAPFQNAQVQGNGNLFEIQLPPQSLLLPGQTLDLNVQFQLPAPEPQTDILVIPGPADPLVAIPYGDPCPGSLGYLPTITAGGVGQENTPITFWIDGGLGGAPLFLMAGSSQIQLPLLSGCDLLTTLDLGTAILPLPPGGPGAGQIAFPILLPGGTPPGLELHLQAFISDPGTVAGHAATNGVKVITR